MDNPAECAKKIEANEVHLGLLPVAVLFDKPDLKIISNYCIGADGPVDSVMLYSEKPIEELEQILLDYQSRTSVQLVKILCKEHWNINPKFVHANENFISQISGSIGGVVIGDRTFNLNEKFNFQYDLSKEWKNLTGLPFVFACWVSQHQLNDEFIQKFNKALEFGIVNIENAIKYHQSKHHSFHFTHHYLTERIKYSLDDYKKRALQLFLSKLTKDNIT